MAEKWIQGAIARPGAFKAKAKAAGKSTGSYARQVLKEGSTASTRTKRQAALAQTLTKLRRGKAKFLLPFVLVGTLSGTAGAGPVSCPAWLVGPAPQAAAAVGPNSVSPRAIPALIVQAMSPTGTATVQIEMCCSPIDCTAAGTWAPVGTALSLAVATPTQVVSIASPACMYRANVTACSGCAVNVVAVCAGP
jgi:hypothetical protein